MNKGIAFTAGAITGIVVAKSVINVGSVMAAGHLLLDKSKKVIEAFKHEIELEKFSREVAKEKAAMAGLQYADAALDHRS